LLDFFPGRPFFLELVVLDSVDVRVVASPEPFRNPYSFFLLFLSSSSYFLSSVA